MPHCRLRRPRARSAPVTPGGRTVTEEATARTPYADQRKNHILDRLLSNGRVDATEVAESLGVTGETIRKDHLSGDTENLATSVASTRPLLRSRSRM